MQIHGKILERTRRDPNEIIIYDDYAEIIIYNSNNIERCRTKIDLDDVERCSKYKWHINDNGYIMSKMNNSMKSLHRFLLNYPLSYIDHINRNKLDNRARNLRLCTSQLNNINSSMRSNNTSGVRGVSWDNTRKKWVAQLGFNKNMLLGIFNNKDDAVKVRKEAELKYFGEYNVI